MNGDETTWWEFDETTFAGPEERSGVDLERLEAEYAELFGEMVERGELSERDRERLELTAHINGLTAERVQQIEDALRADREWRRQVPAPTRSLAALAELAVEPIPVPGDIELLAQRIAHLVSRNIDLEARVTQLERDLDDARMHMTVDVDVSALATHAHAAAPAAHRHATPAELHRRFTDDPSDLSPVQEIFRALRREADFDRRWCAAQALVHAGAADDEARAFYAEHRPEALVRPTRTLGADEWQDLLFDPDEDRAVGSIFAAIAPAILMARVASDGRGRSSMTCAPVEPATSTVGAVRCFAWASAVLGVRLPEIYADPDREGLLQVVLSAPPAVRLGRDALQGRSARELAFLAGRVLALRRQEHAVLALEASTQELEGWFLAALLLGEPRLPMRPEVRHRVETTAGTLAALLGPAALAELRGGFVRFVEAGGRTSLGRWAAAVHATASAAGLLLADDLDAARAILDLEDAGRADERMRRLLVFATSERYAELRRRLGTARRPA